MKPVIWKENKRIKMVAMGDCFLPHQLINMSDGSKKQISELNLNDSVLVWDEEYDEIRSGKVNEIRRVLHDDVYELHLEGGKVLYPTGNHPFIERNKDWVTIDGHNPNHAGGSGKLDVGDYVNDIDDNWLEIVNIVPIDGEHETYNLVNQEFGTIVADDIITHNTSAVVGGTEETISMKVQTDTGEKSIADIEVGDIVLSADIEEKKIVETSVTSIKTGGVSNFFVSRRACPILVLKVSTEDSTLLFTSTHLIPFYRDGILTEDNFGALQVGDEVIVNNDGFDIKPIISIGEAKVIDNDLDVVHPCTEKGYHFVNNILVEG